MRSYLVVGNQTLAGPELASAIGEVMAQDGQTDFHVVVPATPNQKGFTWDENEARAARGAARRVHRPPRGHGRRGVRRGRLARSDRGRPGRAARPSGRRDHPVDAAVGDLALARPGRADAPPRLGVVPVRVVTAARESVEAAG